MNAKRVLMITVLALALPGAPALAGSVKEPIVFRFDPADNAFEYGPRFFHQVFVSGSFYDTLAETGNVGVSTFDVQGQLEGELSGDPKLVSDNSATNVVGPITIVTAAHGEGQRTSHFRGTVRIDGAPYKVSLKLAAKLAHLSQVDQTLTSPGGMSESRRENLRIPVVVEHFCDEEKHCFKGFGLLLRQANFEQGPSGTLAVLQETLELELIRDDGVFHLQLTRLELTQEAP